MALTAKKDKGETQNHGRPVISLLTDFGSKGGYVGAVKAVILSRVNADIVDISNDITPQSVVEGAFVLNSVCGYFPSGTVHLAVVDPGVGTARRAIAVKAGKYYFVGPDNGLLIPAARKSGISEVREIDVTRLSVPAVSNTFHGRDVFAPAAAFIAAGNDFSGLGRKLNRYVDLNFGTYRKTADQVYGMCMYSDTFGNIVTNIDGGQFSRVFRIGEKLSVDIRDVHRVAEFCRAYGDSRPGVLSVLIGSHGNVELAVSGGSASILLGFSPMTEVSFRKLRF
ncbi:MAG: SAM-dependent chlorinase/fluorinase [Thermoplasmata archaeon]|uniref:SAM-dependent chlorinase/fluorinase n=1 Tax=Candidatus Sysuiplasma superficiale TaxID=2823368 RepID=A0A8J7YJ70_9ARCH|nr:SAM-dependent chlorinase/fluorinase [Candidatus Sysuiplasma superficiale]MBX8643260.1 SAM-dependent chlorinase/fluorinase [Candidatus Sysuiplasma superficiale]